jgi:hypothetical protein
MALYGCVKSGSSVGWSGPDTIDASGARRPLTITTPGGVLGWYPGKPATGDAVVLMWETSTNVIGWHSPNDTAWIT